MLVALWGTVMGAWAAPKNQDAAGVAGGRAAQREVHAPADLPEVKRTEVTSASVQGQPDGQAQRSEPRIAICKGLRVRVAPVQVVQAERGPVVIERPALTEAEQGVPGHEAISNRDTDGQ